MSVLLLPFTLLGCTVSSFFYSDGLLQYQPVRPATVTLDIQHTMTQEVRQIWKDFLNTDDTIRNWKEAVRKTIEDDILDSHIFAKVTTNPNVPSDFLVLIESTESRPVRF